MTALDVGCAMGFFSLPMAQMVGPCGKVICVDVQPGMLRVLRRRAARMGLAERIETHESAGPSIGLQERDGSCDFALAFAMLHEVGDQAGLLQEIHQLLKPGAVFLLAEPDKHVAREAFDRTVALTQAQGFVVTDHPLIRLSQTAVLIKPSIVGE